MVLRAAARCARLRGRPLHRIFYERAALNQKDDERSLKNLEGQRRNFKLRHYPPFTVYHHLTQPLPTGSSTGTYRGFPQADLAFRTACAPAFPPAIPYFSTICPPFNDHEFHRSLANSPPIHSVSRSRLPFRTVEPRVKRAGATIAAVKYNKGEIEMARITAVLALMCALNAFVTYPSAEARLSAVETVSPLAMM